eukprot:2158932-Rhodomonas_salina.1
MERSTAMAEYPYLRETYFSALLPPRTKIPAQLTGMVAQSAVKREAAILKVFRASMGSDKVQLDSNLMQMGLDSLTAIEILNKLRRKGLAAWSAEDLARHHTIADLISGTPSATAELPEAARASAEQATAEAGVTDATAAEETVPVSEQTSLAVAQVGEGIVTSD